MERTGWILMADGFRYGCVEFGRRIVRLVPDDPAAAPVCDPPDARDRILPGYVDLHVHGGGGGDTMEGESALRRAARFHAGRGTTAMVATTLTAPFEQLEAALAGVRTLIERPEPGAAHILGAHLEGPWISPERLGAQPPHARSPERWEVERLLEVGPVRIATVAPEIDGGLDLVAQLSDAGVRVQLGHSNATAGVTAAALARGATGFTHLFNAMSGLHHREPGMVGAALAGTAAAELVLDGHHVAPAAFEVARRCIDRWYAVSDAVAVAGTAGGTARLGDLEVRLDDGAARLHDGTLAGSASTLHDALRTLVEFGLPLAEAAGRVSSVPARELTVHDRGRLVEGAFADLVLVDDGLRILEVFADGEAIATGDSQQPGETP